MYIYLTLFNVLTIFAPYYDFYLKPFYICGMAELQNDKEELFCCEYLKDLNQTRAYMRAFGSDNYSASAANATRLVKNDNIRIRIRELMDERSKDTLVDAKYVVESLVEIKDRCMQAEPVLKWDYEANAFVETGEYKFDSIGANKAAELLGKHVGMFNDKLKIDMEVTREVIIEGKKFAPQSEENTDTNDA